MTKRSLFSGAIALLASGLSGKVFRAVLLEPGALTFDPANAFVSTVLAHARNTAQSVDRVPLAATVETTALGVATVRFKIVNPLYERFIRVAGAALLYQFITDDDGSPVVALVRSGELASLAGGDGYDVPYLAPVFAPSGVTPGEYGAADESAIITVDAAGRITAAASEPIVL